jgi:hypothetical protein
MPIPASKPTEPLRKLDLCDFRDGERRLERDLDRDRDDESALRRDVELDLESSMPEEDDDEAP